MKTEWPPREVVDGLYEDAVLFAEGVLGHQLWSKQKRILHAVSEHERIAVKSCHGTGKSFVASIAVIWFLLTRQPSIVFTTAPTTAQVEKILWKEIGLRWQELPVALRSMGRCLTTELKIDRGHQAFGRSTDRPERLQGIHSPHLMVVCDEASGVTDEMYEAIDTLSAGGEYRELLIGNPINATGKFYRAFKDEALGYVCESIPADSTPNFTGEDIPDAIARQLIYPERVKQWRRDWGEESPAYIGRVRAEFPHGDSEAILIPLPWAEEATERRSIEVPEPVTQMGVDVARFGSDRTVVAGRHGLELDLLESLEGRADTGRNIAFVEKHVVAYLEQYGPPITVLIDESGEGAGVADGLVGRSDERVQYQGVNFGSRPTDPERFVCRRDEMHWDVRRLCRPGGSEADLAISARGREVERWKSQVSAIKYEYTSRNKIKLEGKQEMRRRGLPSCDEADAMALAFTRAPRPIFSILA